jgi:hypothetical protein
MTEASKVDPLVKRERIDTLPALQALLNTLMLAEAAEKKLQEMQAHIDHADAYHKAMLAAEADNARLLKIIDAIVDEYDGQMHGPILHTINDARAALTGEETK